MFLQALSDHSLQSLRVFVYVSSMGSVVEAAEAMNLTQPAVSLQIHNLEKQLGFHLFERQGRKNVLTMRGQAFFQKLLPQMERLEQIILSAKESNFAKPELNIGSVEGIGEYWLWSRFSDFALERRDLRLRLDLADADTLEERVLTGRLAFIITPHKFEHPQIVSQMLMDEQLVPVGKSKNLQDLQQALECHGVDDPAWEKVQWIGYGDSSARDPWALRWLENVGVLVDRRFRYHHQVNSYTVIKELLLKGQGICVAPVHTCEEELDSGSLGKLESESCPALKNRLYLSYREGSLTATHLEFKDWLLNVASPKSI